MIMVKSTSSKLDKVVKGERRVASRVEGLAKTIDRSGFREYVDYLSRPWKIFTVNFFAGLFRGLGFVIGATVIVAILVYIIANWLVNLPFIGEAFEWLQTVIENGAVDGFGAFKGSSIDGVDIVSPEF
jgi:hypothetical protein